MKGVMFDVQIDELKQYIFDNKKIEFILENIGCQYIKYHSSKNYFSCTNADGGDNKNAVNIFNDQYLNCRNYTRDIGENADLISLVQFYKKTDFKASVKYIHKLLGLKMSYLKKQNEKPIKKIDPLDVFKRVLYYRRKQNVLEFETIGEDVFCNFVPYIHTSWFKEGIIKKTIDKFGLAYSYKYKRTVVPLRYWITGELLGFNMRSSIKNCEELGILKYYTTPNYPKSINLFGLWENYDSIIKNKYCTVWESEKSVLKRHSRLDKTGVALSGHSISDEQVRILIGLNVNIVIAMDNDVDIQEIRYICSKFYRIRNVSYIYDKWGLLKEKDSPADASDKIYKFMFKHKVIYDSKEHELY